MGRIGYSEKNKQTQSEHVSIRAQKSQVTVTNSIGLSFFLGKLLALTNILLHFVVLLLSIIPPSYVTFPLTISLTLFFFPSYSPIFFSVFKPFLPLCLSLLFSPCFGQNIERERERVNEHKWRCLYTIKNEKNVECWNTFVSN